jgi:hypothetical protein
MVNRRAKAEKWADTISDVYTTLAGKKLARAVNQAGVNKVNQASSASSMIPMKNGSKGTIKKRVQPALLHKGEVVLTAGQVKSLKKLLK